MNMRLVIEMPSSLDGTSPLDVIPDVGLPDPAPQLPHRGNGLRLLLCVSLPSQDPGPEAWDTGTARLVPLPAQSSAAPR